MEYKTVKYRNRINIIKNIIHVALVFMILIATILVSGCNSNNNENSRIGVILPLSGNLAQYGTEAMEGMILAVEESGEKIQVTYEDSQGDPKEGVNAFNKLVEVDNTNYVITGTSFVSLAISPIANEKEIIQMGVFSSNPKYTSKGDYTFRVSPRSEVESKSLIKTINRDKEENKIGVIYVNNDYGVGESSVFSEVIGDIPMESFNADETDFKTPLTRLKSNGINTLVIIGDAKSAGHIIRDATELNLELQFYGLRALENKDLLDIAGEGVEGLIYTYPFSPEKSPEFSKSYLKRFNHMPTSYSAEGYEAMKILINTIKNCEEDTICAKEELNGFSTDSVFGELSFDENGDVEYPFATKQIVNGEFVFVNEY